MNKALVLVVCRGNIGRSPFAQAVIARELAKRGMAEQIRVISRGVQGTAVDPGPVKFSNIAQYTDLYKDVKPSLDKFGVDLSQHTSTIISKEDADQAKVILAMDAKTRDGLVALFPGQAKKVHLFTELVGDSHDVTDPEGAGGADSQEQIFTEIHDIAVAGLPKLVELATG